MHARIRLLALAISLGTFSTACRSSNAYEVGRDAEAVGLVVQNDNFADMDIYAVASGLATRVGTVNGGRTERFDLSSSLYNASDLRIVGAPIGGNGRASTGSIVVHRGNTIHFTIAPMLGASSVSIH
jgi:hypothetical protein